MRRILFVQHYSGWSGSAFSLFSLIKSLDPRRYQPTVLFNTKPGRAVDVFREAGIEVIVDDRISAYPHAQGAWYSFRDIRPWRGLELAARIPASVRRFEALVREAQPDVVHLNSLAQIAAGLGAHRANVPVIWHIREELHPGYTGLRRLAVRSVVNRTADAVIAISEKNLAALSSTAPGIVVYNSVDFNEFDRRISGDVVRREVGVDGDAPVVCMLGGVTHSKGADILAESACQVIAKHPNAVFLIAGAPPEGESSSKIKRHLRRVWERFAGIRNVERRTVGTINSNGLQNNFRFLGVRRDIPQVIAASDIVVWSASVSHFARPIIEAGAMGKPVIASDFDSSQELVRPGVTGILVTPNSASELSVRILDLIENRDEQLRLGENGYIVAREKYNSATNLKSVLNLYDSLLN